MRIQIRTKTNKLRKSQEKTYLKRKNKLGLLIEVSNFCKFRNFSLRNDNFKFQSSRETFRHHFEM